MHSYYHLGDHNRFEELIWASSEVWIIFSSLCLKKKIGLNIVALGEIIMLGQHSLTLLVNFKVISGYIADKNQFFTVSLKE